MDGNSQSSPQHSRSRFLANINSEDSLRKSNNLLEEILGKKLVQLKTHKAVGESAEQRGNSQTRVPESKVGEELPSPAKHNSQNEKQEDWVSIQVKQKSSPRHSEPSESQLGSLMSSSLQKRGKSIEKDQVMITTQDGIKSDKNSEVFDIRVFKVPNGLMQPLDSMSQQSENRGKPDTHHDDNSPGISPFGKNDQGNCPEKDQLKQDLRRSVTEAILQENRPLPEESEEKELEGKIPISQFTGKARRTPTDILESTRKNSSGNKDKGEAWRGKGNQGGYKVSPMISDNDQRLPKTSTSRNKVVPNSSSRAMLEFSDPMTGRVSTDHIILPETERSVSPGKAKVLHQKDRPISTKEAAPSTEPKKSCLKKEGKVSVPPLQDLDDNLSQRNLALSSPAGSKKGILTNKSKVAPNESLSIYEMAHMPLRRSNTQMSRKSPVKVRFSERPFIFEVESYKRYYKEPYSEKECCTQCALI